MSSLDPLSTPRGTRRARTYDPDAFGRFSEAIARAFGTGRYLAIQTGLVIVWITYNLIIIKARAFDPYPFILLNLAFSTQAAYAAPLILLAQNRQSDRDRSEIERDREVNARQLADTEFLARELASIRIALDSKADREDLVELLNPLIESLDRILPDGTEDMPARSTSHSGVVENLDAGP